MFNALGTRLDAVALADGSAPASHVLEVRSRLLHRRLIVIDPGRIHSTRAPQGAFSSALKPFPAAALSPVGGAGPPAIIAGLARRPYVIAGDILKH
jgi:hypothetical protein